MKNQILNSFIILALLGISGCTASRRSGTVTFQPNPPEIFIKNSLKTFIQGNDDPKIVLRVPTEGLTTTEDQNLSVSLIYNAIEKELLKGGFKVRDRGMFNEILEESQNEDYSSIKELTDTDIILEIVGLDINVEYSIDKYIDRRGREKKVFGNIVLNGATVEFKTILVETSELVGTYEFNYVPCVKGCQYYIDDFGVLYNAQARTDAVAPNARIQTSALKNFMSSCTRDMIAELRN